MGQASQAWPLFQYDSPLSCGEIRLLRFRPWRSHEAGGNDLLMRFEIVRVSLDQLKMECSGRETGSPYVALSYVWGSTENPRKIFLEHNRGDNVKQSRRKQMQEGLNGFLEVTQNLETALRHFQGVISGWVWIDAICINQREEGTTETSSQVRQMNEIYRTAQETIVWLGPGDVSSDLAMRHIGKIGKKAFTSGLMGVRVSELRAWPNFGMNDRGRDLDRIRTCLDVMFRDMSNPGDNPFPFVEYGDLMQREWFERVWVLQEVMVAQHVVIVCGSEKVEYDHFMAGAHFYNIWVNKIVREIGVPSSIGRIWAFVKLWRRYGYRFLICFGKQHLIHERATSTLAIRQMKNEKGESVLTLKEHLARAFAMDSRATMNASKAEDRIYALLGISSDHEKLRIIPDYSRNWEDVYVETAKALIEEGHYDILSFSSPRSRELNLPSWVPDWTAYVRKPWGGYIEDQLFSASTECPRTLADQNLVCKNPKNLILESFYVDRITEAGAPWTCRTGDAIDWKGAGRMMAEVERFLLLSNKYSDDEITEAVWRIPIGDKDKGGPFSQTQRATVNSAQGFKELKEVLKSKKPHMESGSLKFVIYLAAMQTMCDSRPFRSSQGHVGLCPDAAIEGDIIILPVGSHVPLVIREERRGSIRTVGREQVDDMGTRHHEQLHSSGQFEYNEVYEVVGEAYVHGIMDGEFPRSHPSSRQLMELK
ncbi:hypothetical protein GJ744_006281 [Endocarpon pusillum]|uniref:Heterokaryon incompatibility domain-containing protein n=1 Tax=Endocarpon pusillum TaxID=364733 RepID=A0A8H7A7Z6_9EURO|nr:hypothetical protein GJ744_006281 [Endocarpon pusillum]